MRLAVLFYTFLVIFVITAVVTLLGVLNIVPIREAHLNMLLGAFILELAGAVVALFKRTDFFAHTNSNLSVTFGSAVDTFDRLSDEIAATVRNQAPPPPNRPHGFIIRRIGDDIVAYRKMQTISKDELDKLPDPIQRQIKSYEKSMNTLAREWEKIKREAAITQLEQPVRDRQLALIKAMKDDLVGIVDTLEKAGFSLDDHYMDVRSLVSRL